VLLGIISLQLSLASFDRHPGEGRDLDLSAERTGEIPAFAGMMMMLPPPCPSPQPK
jgi:hypothetical protein